MRCTFLSSCWQSSFETFKNFWDRQPQDKQQRLPVGLFADALCHSLSFLSEDKDFASASRVCQQWNLCAKKEWNTYSQVCLKALSQSQKQLHRDCPEEKREGSILINRMPPTIEEQRKLYFARQQELVKLMSFLSHQRLEQLKNSYDSSPKTLELLENAQQTVYGNFHVHARKEGKAIILADYKRIGISWKPHCHLAPRLDSRNQWENNDPRIELLKKLKPISLNEMASIKEGEVLSLKVGQFRLHLACRQQSFPIFYPDGTVVNSIKGIKDSVIGPKWLSFDMILSSF